MCSLALLQIKLNQMNYWAYAVQVLNQCIITLNSSKLRTPSPLRSNLRIMALQLSMDVDSPSRLSILFKLLGVIHSLPSNAYFPKASFNSPIFSSSPLASISFAKSSSPNIPSPSESDDSTANCASSGVISPPTVLTQHSNSAADIFPSSFSSKYVNTRLIKSSTPIAGSEPVDRLSWNLRDNFRQSLLYADRGDELCLLMVISDDDDEVEEIVSSNFMIEFDTELICKYS